MEIIGKPSRSADDVKPVHFQTQTAWDKEAINDPMVTDDPGTLKQNLLLGLMALALDQILIWACLLVLMSLIVGILLLVLDIALFTPVGTFHDYCAILIFFCMSGWIGFLTRQSITGTLGVQPCCRVTSLRTPWVALITVVSLSVLIGVYCLVVGAKFITSLFILGGTFTIGFALYGFVRFLQPRIGKHVTVSFTAHCILRSACPAVAFLVLLILLISGKVHRSSVLGDAFIPDVNDPVLGVWEMVEGQDHALYWTFLLHAGPEPASDYQHLSHPIGTKVIRSYVATPLDFDKKELECAHRTGYPAYLILLHDNGVLGFVGKVMRSTQYMRNSTQLDAPTMDELVCNARAEDRRFPIIDVLHGALHGCFCFGTFHDTKTMQRHNRWAWDTGSGWKAIRKA